jgi:cytochrome c oxidase cbb3-type subunit I/II
VKFLVTAVTFYGMSTFEGPLLSIKSVNSLAHYTDWIIGHVHAGALGWNGFLAFGMIYYLVPKLYNTELYSKKLATTHFWLGLTGILFYYISMWASGITQGLMWRAIDDNGNLVYADFVETVMKIVPLYHVRILAGLLFIAGAVVMVYNIIKTIKQSEGQVVKTTVKAFPLNTSKTEMGRGHRHLEGLGLTFSVLTFLAIVVGSVIEILPTLSIHKFVEPGYTTKPYTPLELAGRDIYIREGCYVCHSQMVRKMASDVLRFGEASTIADSMYDRPFQWGSKRTGPDLARLGDRYPDLWHYKHMFNPRDVVQQSLMPAYPWLYRKKTDFYSLRKKVQVMKFLGVPYTEEEVGDADKLAEEQAQLIAHGLQEQGAKTPQLAQKEIVALIAYLQSLGKKTTKSSVPQTNTGGQ